MLLNFFGLFLILAFFAAWGFGRAPKRLSVPKLSDHFSLDRFFIPWEEKSPPMNTFWGLLKWQMTSEKNKWPDEAPSDFVVLQKPLLQWKNFVQYVNHASVLIDLNSTRILTDPQFSEKASPLSFVGPNRHHGLPFALEDLNKVDFVLLSHNHYDHMDLESLKKINELYSPIFIVPHSNGPYLMEAGITQDKIVELDWWESITLKDITLTLTPSQHWSRRRLFDRNFALWGSFVIANEKKKIFFGGDTGFGPQFEMIHERWKEFDLALLPVGAYEPRWFMKYQHLNPEDAVKAHKILAAKKSIGIHHSCFQLADESWADPLVALQEALAKENVAMEAFLYPHAGEMIDL